MKALSLVAIKRLDKACASCNSSTTEIILPTMSNKKYNRNKSRMLDLREACVHRCKM